MRAVTKRLIYAPSTRTPPVLLTLLHHKGKRTFLGDNDFCVRFVCHNLFTFYGPPIFAISVFTSHSVGAFYCLPSLDSRRKRV